MQNCPWILLKHWGRFWATQFFFSFFFLFSLLLVFLLAQEYERGAELLWEDPKRLFYVYLAPSIPWLSSICCFAATILTFSMLERHKEWTTLQACAVSPLWIGAVFLVLSTVIAACNLWLLYTQPTKENYSSDKIWEPRSLQMKDPSVGMWYFQEFNPRTLEGKNLQLYLNDDAGKNYGRLRCKMASWDAKIKKWQFREGIFWGYPTARGVPIPDIKTNRLKWNELRKDIFLEDAIDSNTPIQKFTFQKLWLEELTSDPLPYFWIKENPSKMNYTEINSIIENFPNRDSYKLDAYYYQRTLVLVNTLSCIFVTLLGLILMIGQKSPKVSFIVVVIVIGIVSFYVLRIAFDKIGERGILNPWICSIIPFLGTGLLFLLLKFKKEKALFE